MRRTRSRADSRSTRIAANTSTMSTTVSTAIASRKTTYGTAKMLNPEDIMRPTLSAPRTAAAVG